MWQKVQKSPEARWSRIRDARTKQERVAAQPESFREVIVLREVEDLYRQISAVLNVPVGTAMSRSRVAEAQGRC